jgi:hypothetical protein
MNTIFSFHHRDPNSKLSSSDNIREEVVTYEPEINTEEGGEYLDDSIRMEDQPFEETTDTENEKSQTAKDE